MNRGTRIYPATFSQAVLSLYTDFQLMPCFPSPLSLPHFCQLQVQRPSRFCLAVQLSPHYCPSFSPYFSICIISIDLSFNFLIFSTIFSIVLNQPNGFLLSRKTFFGSRISIFKFQFLNFHSFDKIFHLFTHFAHLFCNFFKVFIIVTYTLVC